MCNDKKEKRNVKFLDGIERQFALEIFPKGRALKIDDVSFEVVENNGVLIYLRPTNEGGVIYGREDHEKMTVRFIQGNQILEESLYRDVEELLDLPITELDISVRTLNTLLKADFKTIRDIIKCTEKDMLKFRGFKNEALQNLQRGLQAKGLELKK